MLVPGEESGTNDRWVETPLRKNEARIMRERRGVEGNDSAQLRAPQCSFGGNFDRGAGFGA
ncbi:hypothetical protein NTCA1_15210 [Novosphingobium sp. TCA1]|nr:hypothetical protein NTCA1_15210 [Novosphingobium sp. TCA1]